jgi:hypothetical protein
MTTNPLERQMETTPIFQIVADIREASKANKWISCTYQIRTDEGVASLGVKAFGKWVQRMELLGMADGIPEQKTWKAFEGEFNRVLDSMVRSAGIAKAGGAA